MRHEIRFNFGNDTTVVEFDGNAIRMSSELAIFIYNCLIDAIVEDAVKTIEKSPLTEFVHLMSNYKVVVKLKRKDDGEIVEASIIFDALTDEDKKILEQGGDE